MLPEFPADQERADDGQSGECRQRRREHSHRDQHEGPYRGKEAIGGQLVMIAPSVADVADEEQRDTTGQSDGGQQ